MWAWRSTHVPVAAMFMLLAPLLLLPLPASSACHPTERQALLELTSSMHRAHRTPPDGWPDGSGQYWSDCCAWGTLPCDGTTGRVGMLDLDYLEKTDDDAPEWQVKSSIFSSFPELTEFHLAGNGIGGSLAAFVSGLTGLKNLWSLDLSGNSLTGQAPAALGNPSSIFSSFPELVKLDLGDNRIGGSLAAFISGLTGSKNLNCLDLSGNSLTEQVPAALDNLASIFSSFPELTYLDLGDNMIGGSVATFVSGLTGLKNLWSLDLSGNSLTGQVPAALGNLSSIFSSFPELTYLYLSRNRIGDSLAAFVSGLTGLKNLMYLDLTGNSLTGQVPAALGNLTSLLWLNLGQNHLTGKILGNALTGHVSLEELYLSDNSFTGELDLPSRPMLNLTRIDLSVNSIGGSIPANLISMFPNLVTLNLSMNQFTGNIPPALFNQWLKPSRYTYDDKVGSLDLSHNQLGGLLVYNKTSLYFLRLSNNNLHGEIPKCLPPISLLDRNNFTALPTTIHDSLYFLDVHHNLLSGNLPPSIWNQSQLTALILRENQLYGEIPWQLCNLANLRLLDLSQNNLLGTLPSCPDHPLCLDHLNLAGNALTGPITGTFFNSTAILTLDLRKNTISNDLNWIRDLQNIRILALSQNHFEGLVPVELCSLQYIHLMDLSQNNLSGLIPSCLVNTSLGRKGMVDPHEADLWEDREAQMRDGYKMGYGYITNIVLPRRTITVGMVSNYVCIDIEFETKGRMYMYQRLLLSLMVGVDFSTNQLTGQIPPELGQLVRINVLNLSYNQLTGSIPATLSNLQQLESLDISHNKLTGLIPNELVKLTALEVFSVAYNNLSGCTPDMKM